MPPKRRQRRKKVRGRRLGRGFERQIATLQQALDPNATVTHNERLKDRLGHLRQFDVVIRAKVGGHEILGVIECKDWSRPVDAPTINALADKARNVRANLVAIASRKFFTKKALELAEDHGILCLTPLKKEGQKHGLSVGDYWFVRIFKWTRGRIAVTVAAGSIAPAPLIPEKLTLRGHSLLDWFANRLYTDHLALESVGWHSITVAFPSPTTLTHDGVGLSATAIRFDAERVVEVRRKAVTWSGTGLVEFGKNRLLTPAHTSITSEPVGNFSEWETHDGPIPDAPSSLAIRMRAHFRPLSIPSTTLDLSEIAAVSPITPAA